MCGFLVCREDELYDFSKIRLRGGDAQTHEVVNGYKFMHSLLSITGERTLQPFIDGDIVCVYNGEIYNHEYKRSDGEIIIPLYKEYGFLFPSLLDGEFAIALYDFKSGVCVFATDDFGTKPLFVNGTSCASYRSGVGGHRVRPNTVVVKRLRDGAVIYKDDVHVFDFENQIVDTYDRWIIAFQEAIKKRGKGKCFIGLSSGYDSGAIACELQAQGFDFKGIAITGIENVDIIRARAERLGNVEILDSPDYTSVIQHIEQNVECEPYNLHFSSPQETIFHDRAILGLGKICEIGKREGRRVYLSGQGSDEILSDYALFGPPQSELGGIFPDKLYEWKNFRGGCQYAYLMKEEYIAGAYGIETRYPFLDRKLVQEFLHLKPELKNAHYKAPLREYLRRMKFPYEENVKRGFVP